MSKTLQSGTVDSAASVLQTTCWVLFLGYLAYTFLITGAFMSFYRIEQFLYLANFAVVWFLVSKSSAHFQVGKMNETDILKLFLLILILIILFGAISSSLHEGLSGMHNRF
jgi:hypothetical protein